MSVSQSSSGLLVQNLRRTRSSWTGGPVLRFDPCFFDKIDQIRWDEPTTRFHDLRHTYAALLVAAGANPLTVEQRMGHSSITVTMDRYGHLFPHVEDELTNPMDEGYRAAADARGVHEPDALSASSEGETNENAA